MAVAVERRTLAQLPDRVASLSGYDHEVFTSIMAVSVEVAELRSDTLLLDKLRLSNQPVFKIHNLREHIVAKINGARVLKPEEPINVSESDAEMKKKLESDIKDKEGQDPFCLVNFEAKTPLNVFGRVRGKSSATGANLYPASKFHAVLPAAVHHPCTPPTRDQCLDELDVADRFYEAAHRADDRAIYSSYGRNNLDKAGASIWEHGHAQLQQEIGCHEGVMEELLDVFHTYRWRTGRDYFQDLFRAHQVVGLGVERSGVMVMPYLTPLGNRHIRMLAYAFDEPQRDVLFRILHHFMDDEGFGAKAFNFTIVYRPISYDGRDWGGMPAIIADILDRGDITKRNNDVGFSERLLRSPITATDPYRANDGIEQALAA
ncbi:hypothetical protein HYS92_02625 [Candidatus Daviesbacteria bacterium]|nr:hypothetical protein [Candidatus Daviesbacteria bacterium]